MKTGILGAVMLIIGIVLGALIGATAFPTQKTITSTSTTTVIQTSSTTFVQTTTVTTTSVQTVTVPPVTVTQTAAPQLRAQDVDLRRRLGAVVGRYFLQIFPTVAVVTQPNVLCTALASSVMASLPPYAKGFLVMYNATAPDAAAAAASKADAVFLAFGGEEPLPVADKSLRDFLAALAKTDFSGALVVHARAWAATSQFKTVLNDTRIAKWVAARPIYVVLANATRVTFLAYNATTGSLRPLLAVDAATGAPIRLYTDDESLFLRSTVGRVAGTFLFQGYGKVAIITGLDPACVALSGAAYAASRANSTRIIVYTGDVQALARAVRDYSPDAVFIAFGGDMPSYAISQATRDVLTALRQVNYTGAVLLHAFVLRSTRLLSTVLDDDTARWMSRLRISGIVPDLANRRVNIVQFTVANKTLQPSAVATSLPMPEAVATVLAKVLASS
ncbi:MAG: hypothetical protein QXP31_04835 [Pyrobaculum sp.]